MRAAPVLVGLLLLFGCGSARRGLDRPDAAPDAGDTEGRTFVCEEGAARACDCSADHVGVQRCADGAWASCGECVDPSNAACTSGDRVTCVCSEGVEGERVCLDEGFGPCECGATSTDCPEGETRACECGADHVGVQACEDGAWSSCRECVDPGGCEEGAREACACESGEGTRTCEDGAWTTCACASTGGGGCEVHPDCTRYAAKLRTCYPDWGADHYAACDEIFDICDLGDGCNAHYPAHVRCVLATSCADIREDACHPVTCR